VAADPWSSQIVERSSNAEAFIWSVKRRYFLLDLQVFPAFALVLFWGLYNATPFACPLTGLGSSCHEKTLGIHPFVSPCAVCGGWPIKAPSVPIIEQYYCLCTCFLLQLFCKTKCFDNLRILSDLQKILFFFNRARGPFKSCLEMCYLPFDLFRLLNTLGCRKSIHIALGSARTCAKTENQ
jgi:hypothetical protein